MKVLIVQTNLAKPSKTGHLAQLMADSCEAQGASAQILDLADTPLPFCDGTTCYKDPRVHAVTTSVKECDAAVWVSPIYNYDLNAVAKNFLELTSPAWTKKAVGFVVQAGGTRSYMAPMGFANSLMLDHRCRVVSRFVYIERGDFVEHRLPEDSACRERLHGLTSELLAITQSLITLS